MRHQDYLEVSAAPDGETLRRLLVRSANKLDFGIVTAALAVDLPGSRPLFVAISNAPASVLESSSKPGYVQRDPVVRRMKTSGVPFTYDQSLYVEEDAADIWEDMAPHGFKTGIAMAMHMTGGRHFLLGVDRDDHLPAKDVELMRLLADLQLLAVHAQEAAVRVLLPGGGARETLPKLTLREREVMQWTKEGKSAWAVGQILSMSEHTVNYHLRNAMRKLGVSGKHQAILRAMSIGLI